METFNVFPDAVVDLHICGLQKVLQGNSEGCVNKKRITDFMTEEKQTCQNYPAKRFGEKSGDQPTKF